MAELEVRLFGDVSIQQDGRSLSLLTGKALELLCYLLIHRDRAHTRETLSEVLWPEGKPAVAKKYLRQALWQLNRAVQLGSDQHRSETELIVVIDPSWVRINPGASWWLDVSAFERTYAKARDIAGHRLSDHQAHDLEAALDLYRGDLMATWYPDWCSHERDRLQLTYLTMLDQLMGYCEVQRLYAKGLSLGQAVLRFDSARECTHRQLMLLHYRAGDRVSAIRQYERCAAVLTQELGVQPSAGTAALYEQIRADRVPDSPMPPSVRPSSTGPPMDERWQVAAVADLHMRLDQIQASLLALHQSVLQGSGVRFEHPRNGLS